MIALNNKISTDKNAQLGGATFKHPVVLGKY